MCVVQSVVGFLLLTIYFLTDMQRLIYSGFTEFVIVYSDIGVALNTINTSNFLSDGIYGIHSNS